MQHDVTSLDLIAADILRGLPILSVRSVMRFVLESLPTSERTNLLEMLNADVSAIDDADSDSTSVNIAEEFDALVQLARTHKEMALLTALFLTETGEARFRSRDVNGVLGEREKGIRNITNAVDSLVGNSPPLLRVTSTDSKGGPRPQHEYELTQAGSIAARKHATELLETKNLKRKQSNG